MWVQYLQGKAQLVSANGINQLHLFIFVLAISHVVCCATTLGLGRLKVTHINFIDRHINISCIYAYYVYKSSIICIVFSTKFRSSKYLIMACIMVVEIVRYYTLYNSIYIYIWYYLIKKMDEILSNTSFDADKKMEVLGRRNKDGSISVLQW